MLYTVESVRAGYTELTRLLIARGLTITAMESATAGLIASLITDTEGASAVLRGSFVTYSNEAKMMQGVPGKILAEYTVYSPETAAAMADACAAAYGADIGIGITGTTGNVDPENPENSVPGRIHYALRYRSRTHTFSASLPSLPDRPSYKLAAAALVCGSLLELLREDA